MFLSCGFSLPLRSRLLAGPRARDVPGPYPGRGRARRPGLPARASARARL